MPKHNDKCNNCGSTDSKVFWNYDDNTVLCDKCHTDYGDEWQEEVDDNSVSNDADNEKFKFSEHGRCFKCGKRSMVIVGSDEFCESCFSHKKINFNGRTVLLKFDYFKMIGLSAILIFVMVAAYAIISGYIDDWKVSYVKPFAYFIIPVMVILLARMWYIVLMKGYCIRIDKNGIIFTYQLFAKKIHWSEIHEINLSKESDNFLGLSKSNILRIMRNGESSYPVSYLPSVNISVLYSILKKYYELQKSK